MYVIASRKHMHYTFILNITCPTKKKTTERVNISRGAILNISFLFSSISRALCLFRRNGPSAASGRVYENEHHNLQEYTYKKITPCDVCSQVLRGEQSISLLRL